MVSPAGQASTNSHVMLGNTTLMRPPYRRMFELENDVTRRQKYEIPPKRGAGGKRAFLTKKGGAEHCYANHPCNDANFKTQDLWGKISRLPLH